MASRAGRRTGGLTLPFGNAAGPAEVRPRRAGRVRFLGLALTLTLGVGGCATQAALVDVQTEVETMRGQVDRITQQLSVFDKLLQERSSSGQRSQVDLVVRLDQIAADLQTVQGRLEEQAHRMGEAASALDEQSFRLNQLGARLDTTDARLAEQERRVSGAVAPPDQGGTPPAEPPAGQERVVLPGRTPLSGLSPVEAYNLAYNDFIKGSYDLAIQGFQTFLKQYPTSILVPHAVYWLGESYYQTKQYPQSVEQYERLITQFPKNEKLVGALLKQGFAFAAIGDKNKARAALKRVLEEFPRASEANLAKEKLAELR
ncbi:MAG: tol-pal system protein YbgF [Nitrospirota bacterium]